VSILPIYGYRLSSLPLSK